MIATVSAVMHSSPDRPEDRYRYSRLSRLATRLAQSLGRRGRREDRCKIGQGREALVDEVGLVGIFIRRWVAMLDVGLFLGVVEAPTQRDAHQPIIILAGTLDHERW